eukprot:TRINITY_DN20647_c0_g1_i1.p1 TRINITY_DN20647_c0_g1~~TRINITY_DN20647_c0_g1_i1.p1  ORF type:complete len:843 (+),score=111.80 TRINITY_DN20647_c0_g1_i1:278-2530(+)
MFSVSGTATFGIRAKCFWQKDATLQKVPGTASKFIRRGRFVTLLPDHRPPLNQGWTWIKLVYPLWKKGFSVIIPDMPGMGGSSMSSEFSVATSAWENFDWQLVEQTVTALNVTRTHIVAVGAACGTCISLVRNLTVNPTSLIAREHFWYQPDIDFNRMFQGDVGDPPPGHGGEDWRAYRYERHKELVGDLLVKMRLMVTCNRKAATPTALGTAELLDEAVKDCKTTPEYARFNITSQDIFGCRSHIVLPTVCLTVAKSLKKEIAQFLLDETCAGENRPLPNYTPQGLTVKVDLSICLPGCSNPTKGIHHAKCPNHADNIAKKVQELQEIEQAASARRTSRRETKDSAAASALSSSRPCSAPANFAQRGESVASMSAASAVAQTTATRQVRPRSSTSGKHDLMMPSKGDTLDNPNALEAVRRRKGRQLEWKVDSQKMKVVVTDRSGCSMNECAAEASELRPKNSGMKVHQENLSKLNRRVVEFVMNSQWDPQELDYDPQYIAWRKGAEAPDDSPSISQISHTNTFEDHAGDRGKKVASTPFSRALVRSPSANTSPKSGTASENGSLVDRTLSPISLKRSPSQSRTQSKVSAGSQELVLRSRQNTLSDSPADRRREGHGTKDSRASPELILGPRSESKPILGGEDLEAPRIVVTQTPSLQNTSSTAEPSPLGANPEGSMLAQVHGDTSRPGSAGMLRSLFNKVTSRPASATSLHRTGSRTQSKQSERSGSGSWLRLPGSRSGSKGSLGHHGS